MRLQSKLSRQTLPSVTGGLIELTFRAGEDTRDANAPELTLTRDVGLAGGRAGADQIIFKLLRGDGGGEVRPADFSMEMVDPHSASTVGTFSGKAFVAHHSVADAGSRLVETTKLRLNMVKYTRADGAATTPLNVLARR